MENLIGQMKDVFTLATNAISFIKSVMENNENSKDYAKLASSGGYAKLASSGYNAKLASSGDDAKLASSGYYAQLDVVGKKSVATSIGMHGLIKAIKGTWVTLAEYRKNKEGKHEVYFVKTEKVDGKIIKQKTWYGLYDKKFREYQEFDNIGCLILNKKGNAYKIYNFSSREIGYVIKSDDTYSHGKSIKEARESLIYKLSNRDTSEFKKWAINKKISLKQAIQSYRAITGACEYGVKSFCDGVKTPKSLTPKKVIELTMGQFGNDKYAEFFGGNNGK